MAAWKRRQKDYRRWRIRKRKVI